MNRKKSAIRAEQAALWAVPAMALGVGILLGVSTRADLRSPPPDAPPGALPAPAAPEPTVWERAAAAQDGPGIASIVDEIQALPGGPDRARWLRLAYARWVQIDAGAAFAAAGDDPEFVREWALVDPGACGAALEAVATDPASDLPLRELQRVCRSAMAKSDPAGYFKLRQPPRAYRWVAALEWARRDREAALAFADGLPDSGSPGATAAGEIKAAVAMAWGSEDLAAALAWALADDGADGTLSLADWAIAGAASSDPRAAAASLAAQAERKPAPVWGDRPGGGGQFPLMPPDPFAATGAALVSVEPAAMAELLGQLPELAAWRVLRGAPEGLPVSPTARELAAILDLLTRADTGMELGTQVARHWAGGDAGFFARSAAELPPSPGRDALLVAAVARWSSADAAAATEFLGSLTDPALRQRAGQTALGLPDAWHSADTVIALAEVSGIRSVPTAHVSLLPADGFAPVAELCDRLGDEAALGALVGRWVQSFPGEALRWALQRPAARRTGSLIQVLDAWAVHDPHLARASFEQIEPPADVRAAIEEVVEW